VSDIEISPSDRTECMWYAFGRPSAPRPGPRWFRRIRYALSVMLMRSPAGGLVGPRLGWQLACIEEAKDAAV
jgi:hypothetical protein